MWEKSHLRKQSSKNVFKFFVRTVFCLPSRIYKSGVKAFLFLLFVCLID